MKDTNERDYIADMDAIVFEEVERNKGDRDAYHAAIVTRVKADVALLNYLTNPRIEQVVSEWVRERHAAVRFAGREENQDVLDALEAGSFSEKVPPMVARTLRNNANGREVLNDLLIDRHYGGKPLRKWNVEELQNYITGRRRSIATEVSDLKWLKRVCECCMQISGSSSVVVGDVLTNEQIMRIQAGEEIEIKPRVRRRPSATA